MTDTPSRYSRYLLGEEIVTLAGERTWVPPEPVKALGLSDDIEHTAEEGETFFRLSSREYRGIRPSTALWWAIADYQRRYQHPLAPLEIGKTVLLPSLRTIEEIILSEDRLEVPPQMLASLRAEEDDL